MRTFPATATLLALSLALSAPAAADEMALVTSGFLDWDGNISGDFQFNGDGFSISGGVGFGFPPYANFSDPEPGQTIPSFRSGWVGKDVFSGGAVVNGVTYDPIYFLDYAQIRFDSGPHVIPSTGEELITVQAPFTFAPGSRIYLFDRISELAQPSDALFRFGLFGGGIMTSTFRLRQIPERGPRYFYVGSRFDFTADQPNPVPEPGSMLLLGTALAGLAVARRRRSRRSANLDE